MEKRDPAKQRTTSIRKPPPPPSDPADAAPDPDPAAQPAPGIRRRAGAGTGRRHSAGEKLVKTAKPPSKVGAAIKMVLILTVFLGIPGIVAAGFFVKDMKGRNVWVRLGRKFGLFKGDTAVAAEKPIHPGVLGFDENCGILQRQKNEFLQIRRKIELHEQEKKEIPPELAAELHGKIETIRAQVIKCAELFSTQGDWIKGYNDQLGEAEKVFETFAGDENKKMAAHYLLGGAVPDQLKEAAQDPNVLKYVEINQKLERHLYKDFQLREDQVADQGRDATSMVRELNSWRARLPRVGEAAKVEPPKPEPPKPEPEKPKPEPEKPKPEPVPALAVPKLPHPWGAFKAGAWIRTKTTVDAGASKVETVVDTTLSKVEDDGIVVRIDALGPDGKVATSEQKLPLSAGETKALRAEMLKVGTNEVDCIVLETAGVKTWVAKGGPTAGLAPLKVEAAAFADTVNEIGEETVQVGGKPVKCVMLLSEGKQGEAAVQGALWVAGELPGFVVKRVTIAGENRTTT